MYCPNCGTQLAAGINFCPNCGTKVNTVVNTAVSATYTVEEGNMVMLVDMGTCARTTGANVLSSLCGYTNDEALLIVQNTPITVARGLSDAQARFLAQAMAEYGMDVSVYDGSGWRDWESSSSSVWDNAGSLLTGVAAALGLIGMNNRITRDMMHRWDYPYRYNGTRPPVYRLHSTLRVAPPRRVTPRMVPHPTPRPAPMPPHPVVKPAPAPTPRPTMKPAPAPAPRPAVKPAPAPHVPNGPRPSGLSTIPGAPHGGQPGGAGRNGGGRSGGPGPGNRGPRG